MFRRKRAVRKEDETLECCWWFWVEGVENGSLGADSLDRWRPVPRLCHYQKLHNPYKSARQQREFAQDIPEHNSPRFAFHIPYSEFHGLV